MSTRSLRSLPLAAAVALGLVVASTTSLTAQEEAEAEEPGQRIVAITTFSIPHHVRDEVIPYMRRYVIPQNQLNPNVITFRLLIHRWGGDGTEMAFYREYADMAALDAPCGEPCATFRENHPEPEEGDEGYEAYQEAQRLWDKYFGPHEDEVYWTPLSEDRTEGEATGPIWPEEGPGS